MRIKPTRQIYTDYTAEDFKVWRILFERQMDYLQNHAVGTYLEALEQIGFHAAEIPDFEKTNRRLKAATGWRLTVAKELVPQDEFFQLLSERIFPATCWLRTFEELDYLEEPDMFHDVFGHAPLLMHPEYADFMQAFGKLALKWIQHPEAISLFSRVYWFTIEFGLMADGAADKIFGAGILSSLEESRHAMSKGSIKVPLNTLQMLDTPYRTDVLQETYFLMQSFDQLSESLSELETALVKRFGWPSRQRPLADQQQITF